MWMLFFTAPMKPDCSSSLRYQMWFWVWYFASYLLSVIFCHSISNGFSVQFSYLISDSELDISNIHTIRTGGGRRLDSALSKHLADHFVPPMSYCNKTTYKYILLLDIFLRHTSFNWNYKQNITENECKIFRSLIPRQAMLFFGFDVGIVVEKRTKMKLVLKGVSSAFFRNRVSLLWSQ